MGAIDPRQVGSFVHSIRKSISDADIAFGNYYMTPGESRWTLNDAAWAIEVVFLKLLTTSEVLALPHLTELIISDIREAGQASKASAGFGKMMHGTDEPYAYWLARARQYVLALDALGDSGAERSVTKDLVEILRAAQYPISDALLFGSPPRSENEVHRRIEGVLRCIFPDLKHKPTLTKPIKNFKPDTGLPSIRTLIEYKYVGEPSAVPVVADEILADTRGYSSKDWDTFVYVIYETRRIKPEAEWNLLLRECEVSKNTKAVVLFGEQAGVGPWREKRTPRRRAPKQS
jgi:hypothetical protein